MPVRAGLLVLCVSIYSPPTSADDRIRSLPPADEVLTADWIRQAELRFRPGRGAADITPEEDAAGGCDGIKNGQWGFHTLREESPWWQVDLRRRMPIDRIVVYNRTDFAERSSRILVLLSGDGRTFRRVYQHDGTVFRGQPDGRPLRVDLEGRVARYVRLQLPGTDYFHLDEVEIYALGSDENIALGRPATQSSTSQWSSRGGGARGVPFGRALGETLRRGRLLAEHLEERGVEVEDALRHLGKLERALARATEQGSRIDLRPLYLEARRVIRTLALSNPLLDFDDVLFVKRAPPTLPHMSDQFYGWWSRPGGGIYVVEDFRSEAPRLRCLTRGWPAGSFLRPDLSHDGQRVVFAYCRYYPEVAGMEKVDKERLPEDCFYHLFEMNVDGSSVRQLTRGGYDDFDARYLPSGEVVFLSTRKGQFLRSGRQSALATTRRTCPDSYVRCGGDNRRPVAVFTLHAMDPAGDDLRAISAFENFEWTPSVAADGQVLYARWDYIDRFNGHFMSLWSTHPDGTNPQLVYGNFTQKPQCVFEARSIPDSHRMVFTACAHHSNTGGSLVLLDRAHGTEGGAPLERLTPEVPFPETEAWVDMYYANPYPLSERFFLCSWSDRRLPPHRGSAQVTGDENPVNASGIYLYDAFGNLELLHRDPAISSMYPLPLRPRQKPPVLADTVAQRPREEGEFLLQDVYRGLGGVERGSVRALRIIGVPPKTQPHMNQPVLGVSREDPGKFILGTVPVEEDGSAYFLAPAGIPLFFQALDGEGLALQTMRTLTYVQPGQTLSCIGCHESRREAPRTGRHHRALARKPSRITPAPPGSWPLRYDRLVQPVLDRRCVSCHAPGSKAAGASSFDLTEDHSYDRLIQYADRDLEKLAFERDASRVGDCPARRSRLLAYLEEDERHREIHLSSDDRERLFTWMDTYAHRLGSFSREQERDLTELRARLVRILGE